MAECQDNFRKAVSLPEYINLLVVQYNPRTTFRIFDLLTFLKYSLYMFYLEEDFVI